MVVGYLLWKNEFPWPTSLTWQELPRKLDSAQEWLLEQRTEGSNPSSPCSTASVPSLSGS